MRTIARNILTICLSTFICSIAFAQGSLIKAGDDLMEDLKWYDAISKYEEAAEKEDKDAYLAWQLGNAHYNARDYVQAEKWFKKTMDLDASTYNQAAYMYATCLKMNGNYEEAYTQFITFSKKYRGYNMATMKRMAKNAAEGCEFAMNSVKTDTMVIINHLNKMINSAYTEYAPVSLGDNQLIFSALSSDENIVLDPKVKDKKVSKLYKSYYKDEEWTKAKALEGPFNNSKYHVGNACYSSDRRRFYFTRCTEDSETKKLECALWVSERGPEGWEKPIKFGKDINNPNYSITSVAVSTNKRGEEIIYFVSDNADPGSTGGKDIWYTKVDREGNFRPARNIGRKINTSGDEVSIFFNPAEERLYFSSNGLDDNIGGFDIYYVTGNESRWSKPVNMGKPYNSSYDDLYFNTKKDGQGGFFVSNRPGSYTLRNETCCDDIFSFEFLPPPLEFAINGSVLQTIDTVKKGETKSLEGLAEGSVVSIALLTKAGEEIIIDYDTIKAGDETFFFNLMPDKTYKLTAVKDNFISGFAEISTVGLEESDTLNTDLNVSSLVEIKEQLIEKVFVLDNVYFDFDKATIKPESKYTLDSLVNFMMDYPQLNAEVSAHTDSKGSDSYNAELSQKRAMSVRQYLVNGGVTGTRLTAVGYGESKPIASNENEDGSDNPEGRAMNRRTEFKITGVVENTTIKYERRFKPSADDLDP